MNLACGAAIAQTEQGNRLVGGHGTLHFDTEGTSDEKGFFIIASPRLGFFVANNIAVGGVVPVGFASAGDFSSTTVGFTPFVRGYIGSSATRLLLEGRAGYMYTNVKFKSPGMDDFETSDTSFGYGIGAGLSQFLNEHVGLEILLTYDKHDSGGSELDFRNMNGININVGFQIYLTR